MMIYFKRSIFSTGQDVLKDLPIFKKSPNTLFLLEVLPTNGVDLEFIMKIAPKELSSFDEVLFHLIKLVKLNYVDFGIEYEVEKKEKNKSHKGEK